MYNLQVKMIYEMTLFIKKIILLKSACVQHVCTFKKIVKSTTVKLEEYCSMTRDICHVILVKDLLDICIQETASSTSSKCNSLSK